MDERVRQVFCGLSLMVVGSQLDSHVTQLVFVLSASHSHNLCLMSGNVLLNSISNYRIKIL